MTDVKAIKSTWHNKCGWEAEAYFDDPQMIALCHAIEASDIAEIDRLVATGANVNAQGKGKMTPLLWAFPDNKLERFKRMLEHGADPNVVIESDFNTHGGMRPGDSVTHLACKTAFPEYFELVFANGGNPNLIKNGIISKETPLFTLIQGSAPNKLEKVKLLIDAGADLDYMEGTGGTPVMSAVGWGGQFDIALVLLEAGADPGIYQSNQIQKLAHVVVRQESGHLKSATPQQKADYQKLVNWLNEHGESIEEARADMERWNSWSRTTGEYRRKMDREIAARKVREKGAAKRQEAITPASSAM
jgi:uncharacterized protein